ncbi:MAG: hypothetical protein ABJG41_11045 [Cyclobacteriaceae bacterium]
MKSFLLISFICLSTVLCASSTKEDIKATHDRIYTLLSSNPDLALKLSQESEIKAHNADLIVEEANSIYIQAWILKKKKFEPGKSFILYLKALDLLKPVYRDYEEGLNIYLDLLVSVGNILIEHHALDEARVYYEESLSVSLENNLPKDVSMSYRRIATLTKDQGNINQALGFIEKSVYHARVSKDEKSLIMSLNSKGLLELEAGLYAPARRTYRQILEFDYSDKDFGNTYIGKAWHNIGFSYDLEENYAAAILAYRNAEDIKRKYGTERDWFITLKDISETYFKTENMEMSEQYALRALEHYDKVQLKLENYELYEQLASIYFTKGDYVKSREYTEKFLDENDKFIKMQEKIQRTKDQYKMEILAAGFFAESNSKQTTSMYSMLLSVMSGALTLTILGGLFWQHYTKRNIRKALQDIEKNSFV